MGAWGNGIYDNDTAMDCLSDYEDSLKQGKSIEQAIEDLKQSWYINDNWSILVIADLEMKNLKVVNAGLKVLLNNVIREELKTINEWKEPKEREKVLSEFYNTIKYSIN